MLGAAFFLGIIIEGIQYIDGNSTASPGWALATGLIASSAINYLIFRDILYPGFIFSAVWSVAAITYVFFPFEIDSLSWTTVCIFLGGNLCFSLGCFAGHRRLNDRPAWFTTPPGNAQPRRLLLLLSVIAVPSVAYSAMRLVGIYSLSSALFIALRDSILDHQTEGTAVYGNVLLSIAPTISVSTAFILLIEERRKWMMIAGLSAAIMLAVLTTGRSLLLLLFSGWVTLVLLRKPERSLRKMAKKLAVAGVLVAFALTLVPLLTKRETQGSLLTDKPALAVAGGLTAYYMAGPLAGFDYVVRHRGALKNSPNNTFAQFLTPLSVLGFRYNPPPAFEPFYPVPFLINVFTAFKTYYVDYGVTGCLVAFALVGFLSGYIFRSSTRGNRMAAFFYAYLSFAALFSPFQDVYHSFNRYLYVALFWFVYFYLSRKLPDLRLVRSRQEARP